MSRVRFWSGFLFRLARGIGFPRLLLLFVRPARVPQARRLLKAAFRRGYDVEAVYIESVPVVDTFGDQIAWEGIVDVFDIKGHDNVKRGYGWPYGEKNGEIQYTTVLGVVPINSPLGAVRAFIRSRKDAQP